MGLKKTLYMGTFVHCTTLTELDVCHDAIIGVDQNGKIAFVLRDQRDVPSRQGWEGAERVQIADDSFFFPGFIGETSLRPAGQD